MDAVELFAIIVGFFILGLAVYSVVLYWVSRSSRHSFGGLNERLGEIGFYLNEFRKNAAKLRATAADKATAAFVEKRLLHAAKEIESEQEFQKERARFVAVRPAAKRKEKEKSE